jgi:hypothetical protein
MYLDTVALLYCTEWLLYMDLDRREHIIKYLKNKDKKRKKRKKVRTLAGQVMYTSYLVQDRRGLKMDQLISSGL